MYEPYGRTSGSLLILSKPKQSSEENKSYTRLKVAITNSLMLVKFRFFANTAKVLNKFLIAYQTEKPMVPFLVNRRHHTVIQLNVLIKGHIKQS